MVCRLKRKSIFHPHSDSISYVVSQKPRSVLSSHVKSIVAIATTMNISRQQKREEKKPYTYTLNENGKIAEFHNSTWTTKTHLSRTCDVRTKTLVFIYFLMLFSSCVCFFSLSRWIRFKNKVRFSSFRASLRKSPSVLFFHFEPHIFSLPVSCWPFQIGGEREYVNVLCVSHTLMPPMSTHATSRIYFYFPCVFDAYGGRAHSKTSLAHPIFILACLCPFCVRFYSFRSTFFFCFAHQNIAENRE